MSSPAGRKFYICLNSFETHNCPNHNFSVVCRFFVILECVLRWLELARFSSQLEAVWMFMTDTIKSDSLKCLYLWCTTWPHEFFFFARRKRDFITPKKTDTIICHMPQTKAWLARRQPAKTPAKPINFLTQTRNERLHLKYTSWDKRKLVGCWEMMQLNQSLPILD